MMAQTRPEVREKHWPEPEPVAAPRSFEPAERGRLVGQGLVNGCGNVASGIIAILLIPVMLMGLGTRLFGLWVLVWTVVNLVSAVADLGVHLTVIREVGAAGKDFAAVARLIKAAANLYLRLAIVGALVIVAAGVLVVRLLQATPETQKSLAMVFVWVSVPFIAGQMTAFQQAVLEGLQRFDLSNLLSVSASLFNALGIVGVLAYGGKLLGVVEVQAAVSLLVFLAAYLTVTRLVPGFAQRPAWMDWDALRPHVGFSVLTEFLALANTALWEGPSLLIGLILGPALLVPFHLGRKFPHTLSTFAWELTAVITPMASRHERTGDVERAGEALEAGTRWVVVSTLPVYIVLAIIGPDLLRTWLGHVPAGTVLILRLMIVAAFATTMEGAASSVLLGRGSVGFLLVAVGSAAIVVLGLSSWLLHPFGPVGAAVALALSVPIYAFVVLRTAGRSCNIPVFRAGVQLLIDTWAAAAACACVTFLVGHAVILDSWPKVIGASFLAAIAYFSVYWSFGAREEEKLIVRRGRELLLDYILSAAAAIYPLLRAAARMAGISTANHPRLGAITLAVLDPERKVEIWDRDYVAAPDHWGYTTGAYERERHEISAGLLDKARRGRKFARALEIGCAEGVFTEKLAARCESLVAADFSEIALERARERCARRDGVTFLAWNLRDDPVPGKFDLIVVMDVLRYIRRPAKLRQVFDKMASGLNRAGLLFACEYRLGQMLEDSRLGQFLLFGGKWVIGELAVQPGLEVMERFNTDNHVFLLMRKL